MKKARVWIGILLKKFRTYSSVNFTQSTKLVKHFSCLSVQKVTDGEDHISSIYFFS